MPGQALDDLERSAIIHALAASQGNRTRAAKQLGISRRALLYKIARLDLPTRSKAA
jgi:sigma-54 dependent transcriptional regulator